MDKLTEEKQYRVRTTSFTGVLKDIAHGSQIEAMKIAKERAEIVKGRIQLRKIEVVNAKGSTVWQKTFVK